MPNWKPNRDKVKWDYGAASDAANELRRAAALLRDATVRRRASADVAKAEWRGRFRDQFDHDLTTMVNRALELADQMESKAREIEGASERAQAEEKRRRSEIERWEREKREEERRERERKERERRRD